MRLFRLFRKKNPVIFSDKCIGKLRGNILESVAPFFPEPYSSRILCEPELNVRWKTFERILWTGENGQRFYVEQSTCERIHEICSAIYQPRHVDKDYPNIFNGFADGLPLICIEEDWFVIWSVHKIQVQQT